MQRLGFGHVLQHRVVLHGAAVDGQVDAERTGQIQEALLLTAHRGPAGAGRHEQRLDAERVAGAEQLARHGVPEREREHATQPRQRLRAPMVVGRDDGLPVALGGEHGAVPLGQFGA